MAVVVLVGGAGIDTVIGNAVAIGVAWWLGDRWRRTGERAERAERLARNAAAAERLRIARELHDVVAHALSVIAVQAGTGRVVLDADVETARAALASIEAESRTALGEMRRLLEVLRDDDAGTAALAPSPGLDDLDTLVAATVRSGLPVEVRIEGERTPMPTGAELAAYRIVQEALTNARKHARASRVEVRVSWLREAVEVEVLDDGDGSAASPAAQGNGLIGMRERAALYGGRVEAGERAGGGFRVAAHIPTGPA
jgi:signal transduction histidine kinase